MILEKLKLANIRSYSSQEIGFSEGSTLLSGDIGAGKSSILMALEFGLFGLSKGQLTGSMLLRNGTSNANVEVQFRLGKDKYLIKRFLKKQNDKILQTSGYILENDVKKDMTALELKAYIINLLGYPKESLTRKSYIYRYTLYTPQEEMKAILFEDKDERLDTLRRIFGIDKYKQIRENAVVFIRSLKERQKLLQGKTEDLPQRENEKLELSKEYGKVNSEIAELKPEIEKMKIEITKKKQEIEKTEKDMKNLVELKKNFALKDQILQEKITQNFKNNKEIKEIEEAIAKIKKAVTELEAVKIEGDEEEIEMELKDMEYDFEKKNNLFISSKEKLNNFDQRLEEFKERLDKIKVSEKDLELRNQEKKKLMTSIRGKYESNNGLASEEEELKKVLAKLHEAEVHYKQSFDLKEKIKTLENCPTCFQEVDDEHKKRILLGI
jgi:exonuclease SbcC